MQPTATHKKLLNKRIENANKKLDELRFALQAASDTLWTKRDTPDAGTIDALCRQRLDEAFELCRFFTGLDAAAVVKRTVPIKLPMNTLSVYAMRLRTMRASYEPHGTDALPVLRKIQSDVLHLLTTTAPARAAA